MTAYLVMTEEPCPAYHDSPAGIPGCASCGHPEENHTNDFEEIWRKVGNPTDLRRPQNPVERPWGFYRVIAEGPGYKVKLIEVSVGARLSLQSHAKREERWVVVRGMGLVTHGEENFPVIVHDTVGIWRGVKHRMANTGGLPLVFMEVRWGA